MPREALTDKAARLLADRRLHVTRVHGDDVEAVVIGDHGRYDLRHHAGYWTCSCPARRDCAHVIALRAVTTPAPTPCPTATADP
jgi:uncharacterized Zn finger protein